MTQQAITRLVLCQNCLRVREYTLAKHTGEEPCECGGDFCGCDACINTINSLVAGKRKAHEVNCEDDIAAWNPQDGQTI